MRNKILIGIISLIFNMGLFSSVYAESAATAIMATKDIRLYTLNCGTINVHDMTPFSDTHFYPRKARTLADPCFLIKHPRGWLLWDSGLGDQYAGSSVEDTKHDIGINVPISLTAQLKQLGLKPDDIKFVAISHAHFDHTGNIALFPKATFLMQKKEYDFTQRKPLQSSVMPITFGILKNFPKKLLEGDYDVFGDGTVLILSTPGHTPGHQSLEVVLPHQGVIVLSGDLYHTREAYQYKLVPAFNTSRAETLTSMNRIDTLLKDTKGRLIIQHDADDFAVLPAIPDYLN